MRKIEGWVLFCTVQALVINQPENRFLLESQAIKNSHKGLSMKIALYIFLWISFFVSNFLSLCFFKRSKRPRSDKIKTQRICDPWLLRLIIRLCYNIVNLEIAHSLLSYDFLSQSYTEKSPNKEPWYKRKSSLFDHKTKNGK